MRAIIKNGMIYGLSEGIKKITPFVLLPLFIHELSVVDFGKVELITLLCTLLSYFISWGSTAGLLRLYFEEGKHKSFVFLTLMLINSLFIVFLTIGYILELVFTIHELIGFSSPLPFFFCFIFSWLFSITNIGLAILRAEEKLNSYALFNIVAVILQVTFIIMFLKVFNLTFESKVYGLAASYFILSMISYYFFIRNKICYEFINEDFRKLIRFYTPLVGVNVLGWISGSIDKIIVRAFLGETALGVYSLAIQIAQIFKLIMESFLKSLMVMVFKYQNIKDSVIDNEKWVLLIISTIGVFFLLTVEQILKLDTFLKYDLSFSVLILAITTRVLMLANFMQVVMYLERLNSTSMLIINFCVAFVIIIFSLLFVQKLGIEGVLLSIFVARMGMYTACAKGNGQYVIHAQFKIILVVFPFIIYFILSRALH